MSQNNMFTAVAAAAIVHYIRIYRPSQWTFSARIDYD